MAIHTTYLYFSVQKIRKLVLLRYKDKQNRPMVIFFSIFFGLIAVNAFLLVFSARNNSAKSSEGTASAQSQSAKIYPLDLNPSKFKKAI